jgi:hypothetical protein
MVAILTYFPTTGSCLSTKSSSGLALLGAASATLIEEGREEGDGAVWISSDL